MKAEVKHLVEFPQEGCVHIKSGQSILDASVNEVVTGKIRLGSENHLIAMGYPVNVASRLQTVTKDLNNSLVISHSVFSLLNNPPSKTKAIEVDLKGTKKVWQVHLLGKPYNL